MSLKAVFDQEIFVIEDTEYTDSDLQKMSLDDLEILRFRINKNIGRLKVAISEKKIDNESGDKGTDKEWLKRRKAALSINERVLTYVIYLIKKRARSGRTIGDYFMEAAKSVLPRGEFESILTKAHNGMRIREN